MNIDDQIKAFLIDPERRDLISHSALERRIGVSRSTLQHFLAGRYYKDGLPGKIKTKLLEVLPVIGFVLKPTEEKV